MKTKQSSIWIYGLICLMGASVFLNTFWNADELWNYNFAKCVVDGLVPYRDFNMVSTPLSIYITAFFFKLLGSSLFTYRIVSYVLQVVTYVLLYRLGLKITNRRLYAFIAVVFAFGINLSVYIYNYNNVALCIILLILLLEWEIASGNATRGKNVAIGLCVGVIPLLKQSIGVLILLVHGVVCLYSASKREKKEYLMRILLSGLPGTMYVVYLLVSDTFMEFVDYAILGIGDFTYRISLFDYMAISPINFVIGLVPIGVLSYGLYDIVVRKNGNTHKYVYCMYVFTWLFAASYPMCDEQHFFAGLVPVLPLGFLFMQEKERHKEILFYVGLIFGTFMLMLNILVAPDLKNYPLSEINRYEGIPMAEETAKNIDTVCAYIGEKKQEGYDVYIAYEYAAMYHIPLDTYVKNWDLLLVGNLGMVSIEKMLDVEANSIFLVPKKEVQLNKMAHVELMEYIREHYLCIDEVEQFEVYRKVETK